MTWATGDWEPLVRASVVEAESQGVRFLYAADPAEILRLLPEADALYCADINPDIVRAGKRLRWIHFMRGGIPHPFPGELSQSEVVISCLKDLFAIPGAEHAIMAMLMICRRMTFGFGEHRATQADVSRDGELHPCDFSGCTVGLLGHGNIGSRTADAARALGAKVLVSSRTPIAGSEFYPINRRAEMLSKCDFAVLALPLTSETAGIFDARSISAMKSASWLIDISGRPQLIDYGALRAALESHRIGGAFLQPCGPTFSGFPSANDRFWKLPNVIVSPCRTVSTEQRDRSLALFGENLKRFEAGEPLSGLASAHLGY